MLFITMTSVPQGYLDVYIQHKFSMKNILHPYQRYQNVIFKVFLYLFYLIIMIMIFVPQGIKIHLHNIIFLFYVHLQLMHGTTTHLSEDKVQLVLQNLLCIKGDLIWGYNHQAQRCDFPSVFWKSGQIRRMLGSSSHFLGSNPYYSILHLQSNSGEHKEAYLLFRVKSLLKYCGTPVKSGEC